MTNLTTIANVNIGGSPNDGTGDNIRNAFSLTNTNFNNVVEYLTATAGPTFVNANVDGTLTSSIVVVNSELFATLANVTDLNVLNDLHVAGTMYGPIHSEYMFANVAHNETLVVAGAATLAGLKTMG